MTKDIFETFKLRPKGLKKVYKEQKVHQTERN